MLRKSRKPKAINPMAKQPRRPRTPVGKRPTPKLPTLRTNTPTKKTKRTNGKVVDTFTPTKKTTPTPKLPTHVRTANTLSKAEKVALRIAGATGGGRSGKLSKMAEKLKPSNSMLLRKGKPVNRPPISTRRHPIHKLGRGMTGTVKR